MTTLNAVVCSTGRGINGLHIIRSLGRHGLQVGLVTRDPANNLARLSRYTSTLITYDQAGGLTQVLLELAKSQIAPPVLFFDNDEMLWTLAPHAQALARHYRLTTPLALMESLLDKQSQMQSARQAGLAVPRTWWPSTWDEVRLIGPSSTGAFVAKPSPSAFRGHSPFKVMRGSHTEEFAARLSSSSVQASDVLIQEAIPGHDQQIWFCLCYRSWNANSFWTVTGHKIRQSGSGAGGVMALGQLKPNPEVERLSRTLLLHLDYHGLCGVEFKYHPPSNKYYFIEISTRTERFHGILAKSGLDLTWLAYLDALGQSGPASAQLKRRVLWVDLFTTLQSLRRGIDLTTLVSCLGAFPSRVQGSLFSADDLKPSCEGSKELARWLFQGVFRPGRRAVSGSTPEASI